MPRSRAQRRSIRLQGFDYRKAGAYFVTVVTVGRECLLGEVVEDKVHLSLIGRIVVRSWRAIPDHFPHAGLDAFVVMPNHLHGILILRDRVGAKHASPLQPGPRGTLAESVSAVVQAFKSASTRLVNRDRGTPGAPLWQHGFYDHVIRSDAETNRLRAYIATNPLRWALDRENPATPKP